MRAVPLSSLDNNELCVGTQLVAACATASRTALLLPNSPSAMLLLSIVDCSTYIHVGYGANRMALNERRAERKSASFSASLL